MKIIELVFAASLAYSVLGFLYICINVSGKLNSIDIASCNVLASIGILEHKIAIRKNRWFNFITVSSIVALVIFVIATIIIII